MVDFIRNVSTKTVISCNKIIHWFGIEPGKYYSWKLRYGKINHHNGWIPRDWWITDAEKQAIIRFYIDHPFEGYRRLTYMMMDANIVALSPASVYRILSAENLIAKSSAHPSKKGTGFVQPLKPHEHWHIDICYININGTFYYMATVIDGYSRLIVHWEIAESMLVGRIELILQKAKELFPGVTPRIISDNGPQFIAKDFKDFIRLSGMTHVKTSPFYPQSNGKCERVQKTIKQETIRKKAPQSIYDAQKNIATYIEYYNNIRLHSAIDYISPADKLAGRAEEILLQREKKLADAREKRKLNNCSNKAA